MVEFHLPAAPVDNAGNAGNFRPGTLNYPEDFSNRATRRDHVLTDEHAFTAIDCKTAAKLHDAVCPLSKHCPNVRIIRSDEPAYFLSHNNAAKGRCNYCVEFLCFKMIDDFLTETLCVPRIL
jgi:hypothetical protein